MSTGPSRITYLPGPNVDWNKSYADLLRAAMRSKGNLSGGLLSIRDLAAGTRYSYEHVRKVLAGEPVVSRNFNDTVAEYLQLDAGQLWVKAKREKLAKAAKRLGVSGLNADLSLDRQLVSLWALLPTEDQAQVVRFAERLVKANMVVGELMYPDTSSEPAKDGQSAPTARGKVRKRRPKPRRA